MKKLNWIVGFAYTTITLSSGTAVAKGIDGTGSIATCPATGKIASKPALVTGGTEAGGAKLSAKSSGPCSGGTGDGANIVGFKARGAGTAGTNSCTNFDGASSTDLATTLKWKVSKGSPKLNPSIATFSLQPGMVTGGGNQTFDLSGVITAGSFTGAHVTAHMESDETSANLLNLCDGKGIKKITFGADGATNSCLNVPNMHAAITKQITTIDSNDVPHLEVEITTVTNSPFKLTQTGLTTIPSGMILDSASSSCALETGGKYRCRHAAFFQSTGACRWDGNYRMALSYTCDPANTCELCGETVDVDFTLSSENFCSTTTVFCVADLSCSEATARTSSGGVPCCSDTYTPLNSCLSQACASECPAAVNGTGGINPDDSACYSCVFYYCHDQYFACADDTTDCFTP